MLTSGVVSSNRYCLQSLLVTVLAWIAFSVPVSSALETVQQSNWNVRSKDYVGSYVGSEACTECHQKVYDKWKGSNHQQAIQHASDTTVKGNFNNANFKYNGITTRFYRKGNEFWVNTDGPSGKLGDFKVAFTFGVEPLQQYLLEMPGGRYQAFTFAWDTRTKDAGGQRWFHLYPDDLVDHEDVLHWSRASFNWNSRCAHCHSTNLKKNYDHKSNSYNTQWSEISVGCEACHGPAKDHISWAETKLESDKSKGLLINLSATAQWLKKSEAVTASTDQKNSHTDSNLLHSQINQCGLCHSRRTLLDENYGIEAKNKKAGGTNTGAQYLQTYEPQTINEPLYHADGQIFDEVFVLGSFLQSKMHGEGVVCSNCHDPHNLSLKQEGNKVCTQCHTASVFDTTEHHKHGNDSAGAQCANCHMPETTYMKVDPRRDHSIRIPRPDLSKELESPNACSQCHTDKSIDWAVEHFSNWYPERIKQAHVGETFAKARDGILQTPSKLLKIANNEKQPSFIRAAAFMYLRQYPSQEAIIAGVKSLKHKDATIRLAALRQLGAVVNPQLVRVLWPLLTDNSRAVRFEAARMLAPIQHPDPKKDQHLTKTIGEYEQFLKINADSPGQQMQLGVLYVQLNKLDAAQEAYKQALKVEPQFIPALVNWADLHRAMGQEQKAREKLERALKIDPLNSDVNYALGLSHMRKKSLSQAAGYLKTAVEQTPNQPHYIYVYAVVLYENGKQREAINTLKQGLEKHPNNPELMSALKSYQRAIDQ